VKYTGNIIFKEEMNYEKEIINPELKYTVIVLYWNVPFRISNQ